MTDHPLIRRFELAEREKWAKDMPDIRPGDTIKVYYRIKELKEVQKEGGKEKPAEELKERIQPFEGVVIAIKHGGSRRTITVRKISYGVGVERVFPLYSPHIAGIEVIRRGRSRRAKLYYLRKRIGKAAKVKEASKQLELMVPVIGEAETSEVESETES